MVAFQSAARPSWASFAVTLSPSMYGPRRLFIRQRQKPAERLADTARLPRFSRRLATPIAATDLPELFEPLAALEHSCRQLPPARISTHHPLRLRCSIFSGFAAIPNRERSFLDTSTHPISYSL